jgi:hypothetical protein
MSFETIPCEEKFYGLASCQDFITLQYSCSPPGLLSLSLHETANRTDVHQGFLRQIVSNLLTRFVCSATPFNGSNEYSTSVRSGHRDTSFVGMSVYREKSPTTCISLTCQQWDQVKGR